MTRTAASVRALMRAADPLPPAMVVDCDSHLDDDLAELLARVQAEPAASEAAVWDIGDLAPAPAVPPRRLWAVPAIAAVAAVVVAVAITLVVAAGGGDHRSPAGEPSSTANRSLSSQESAAAAAAREAARKAAARSVAAAQAAARECAHEVGATMHGMVTAYRNGHGGKAAALHFLESVHPPSSRLYTRDAAAFGDWLTRGGAAGTITVESAVARACIQ